MNFDTLVRAVGALPCFDFPLLAQISTQKREIIRVQLSRWMHQGKVISLRRGMYALAESYRRIPLTPAFLANHLYSPSYLSGLWALGFHDLIPEKVVWLTSVTARVPRRFQNPFGVFDYRHVKQEFFFGYRPEVFGNNEILVAEPEKALLDHWHLTPGEWTTQRLEQMRFQNNGLIKETRLRNFAQRWGSPRLTRAVERFFQSSEGEEQGTVTL